MTMVNSGLKRLNRRLNHHYNLNFEIAYTVSLSLAETSNVTRTVLFVAQSYKYVLSCNSLMCFRFEINGRVYLIGSRTITDYPYTVVLRQFLFLQCDVLPSIVANVTLDVS